MLEAPEAPLIDEAELAQSLELFGRARMVPIYRAFAACAVDEANAIAATIAARQPERARRLAHALKGAAFNLSAKRLAMAAEALETSEDDLSSEAPSLALLQTAARDTVAWIARRFPS